MVQTRQSVRSNKPNTSREKTNRPPVVDTINDSSDLPSDTTPSNELHIRVEHIWKLYTDDNGRFHVRSHNGKQYTMIVHHCDPNDIISAPFKFCADKHILISYNYTMKRLKDRNMLVDLKILDNETSAEYKCIINSEWGV